MAARLLPTLELGTDETPTSFVSRLARLHNINSASTIATDLGIDYRQLIDGDCAQLRRLSQLSAASQDTLADNAIHRSDNYWNLRRQVLLKTSMLRTSLRLCPACIAEDISGKARPDQWAFGRSIWQLASIRACETHSLAIVSPVSGKAEVYSHDFARIVGPHASEIAEKREFRRPLRQTDFERYLLARLSSAPTPASAWLDHLEFGAAARACEVVGAVRLRGLQAKMKHMSDEDWHAAGQAGFEILSGGETSLRSWLAALEESFPYTRSGTESAQAVFGDFYKWLNFQARDVVFDPVRDVLRQHIVETMPVAAGEVVLGEKIEQRKIHSVHTAAREAGIHPKRLRKILEAHGLVSPQARDANDNRVRFSADAAAAAIDEELDAIPLRAVSDYINADRVHTLLLADNRFIKATLGYAEGALTRYSKRELDRFLLQLIDDAAPVQQAPVGAYSIPAAAKRANCSAAEIVKLILDGKLVWTGQLTSVHGYLSVLVNLDEVKKHVHGAALPGLTAREIEKRLRYSTRVVAALIDNDQLMTTTLVHPINRCPVSIVEFDELSRFEATYVHLHELARTRKHHFRLIKTLLTQERVAPALDPKTYHATFYRRIEANRALDRALARQANTPNAAG